MIKNLAAVMFCVAMFGCSSNLDVQHQKIDNSCADQNIINPKFDKEIQRLDIPRVIPSSSFLRDDVMQRAQFEFDISEQGKPINIKLRRAFASKEYIEKYQETVALYRYTPPKINGEAAIVRCRTLSFRGKYIRK